MPEVLTPPPDDDGTCIRAAADDSSMHPEEDHNHHHHHHHHLDWTAALPQSDHVRLFRATNWARTALGPLNEWSNSLRLFASFVLADSRPACLWWGPIDHLTAVYNESYAPLAYGVHPALMGSTFAEGYPDLWDGMRSFFDQAEKTGTGVNYSSDAPLVVERRGWPEEAFFSGSFVPVGTPKVEGFINRTYEVTGQKIAERRTSMLNALASTPPQCLDAVFDHILDTLEQNQNDVPMAMLYRITQGPQSKQLHLHGHIGLPEGHPLIIEQTTIDCEDGIIPDLRRAGSDTMIIEYDSRFDSLAWKGWGHPSKHIAILPIVSTSQLFGYLVFGTNPYRPHDDVCKQFIQDLSRMVSSVVTSANDSESNRKRQEQLEADLAFSDLKLRHLIDHASVGMCHVSRDGYLLWANDHYYKLAGSSAAEHVDHVAFLDVYHDEDRHKAENIFENLIQGKDHIASELRLKRMYIPPTGDPEPAQIQVLAFPYRDEHGSVRSVMACTTDISRLKWAQSFQARQAAEAREAKRQQEAFIDVVSHEMRNPLSAIVHCADAITTAVDECQAQLMDISKPCLEALNDNAQSAKIILQCANHQKRIIDDILTLSKLDSMLLSITPVAVKPTKLIDSISDIFEAELKAHHIAYDVQPDHSIWDLRLGHVYLDPSRVTQIFINLLTNAIKFVKPSASPRIAVRFGASRSDPRSFFPKDMFWATEERKPASGNDDVTSNPEWGDGEKIYLMFSVSDSGIGLESKEIAKIFERFKQANVKTHVKYGGSGLGLFISKELTEKQGGEIGVSSVAGQGSTFGFYVKTRRVHKQPDTLQELFKQHGGSTQFASHLLNVLLVEDNLINQQVLGRQLKKAGCKVRLANHGLEALDILERETFDIVLMDMEMPVLDGVGAMRQIRQRELERGGGAGGGGGGGSSGGSGENGALHPLTTASRLPIIAVTANVRQEQIDTAIAAGADRVMQKPFKAADLVYLMKSLLPDDGDAPPMPVIEALTLTPRVREGEGQGNGGDGP